MKKGLIVLGVLIGILIISGCAPQKEYQAKIEKEENFMNNLVQLFQNKGIKGNYPSFLIEENLFEENDQFEMYIADYIQSSLTNTDKYDLYVATYEVNEEKIKNRIGFLEDLRKYNQRKFFAIVMDFKGNLNNLKDELMFLNDNLYHINSGENGILHSTIFSCHIPLENMERKQYDFEAESCKELFESEDWTIFYNNLIEEGGGPVSEVHCVCSGLEIDYGVPCPLIDNPPEECGVKQDESLGLNISCLVPKSLTKACMYNSLSNKILFSTSNDKIIMIIFPVQEEFDKRGDVPVVLDQIWYKYSQKYPIDDYPSTLVPPPEYEEPARKGSYPSVIIENDIGEFKYQNSYLSKTERYQAYSSEYIKQDSVYQIVVFELPDKEKIPSFLRQHFLTRDFLTNINLNKVKTNFVLTGADGEGHMWISNNYVIITIYRGGKTSDFEDKKELIESYLDKYPSELDQAFSDTISK